MGRSRPSVKSAVLLISAGQPTRAYLCVRHADIEQLDGVIGNSLRLLRSSMPQLASRSSVAMVMFSAAASSKNNPCSLRFSVRKPMPWSIASRGEWITTGSPSTSIMPPMALRTPKSAEPVQNARHRLARPADDLPGAHQQAARLDFMAVGQVMNIEACFT